MRQGLGALLVVGAIAASACGVPSGISSIEVELSEFGIDSSERSFDVGPLRLTVVNTGEDPHTLVVTAETGEVIIATDLIAPGASVELELDLKPDTYQLTCRIVTQTENGTLIDHFQEGMHTKIEGRA